MDSTGSVRRLHKKRDSSRNGIKSGKTIALTLMALPGAVWLFLIRYLPMFGVLIAFKDFKLPNPRFGILEDIFRRQWVGLDNFKMLFDNPVTGRVIRNTLFYNLTFIVLGLVIAVAFAILLNEISNRFVAKAYQTAMFFPYFLSWVVVSYFVWAFLSPKDGLLDPAAFGLTNFYQQPAPWPFVLIISNVWKMTGYSSILYLAAITGIDKSQYEVASIDGATKWKQIIHITLPNMRTIILILFILNIGRIFNSDFGQFWSLPRDGGSGQVANAVEVVDTFVYRILKQSVNVGQSTAIGLFQNLVGFVCIMLANTVVRKIDSESSLF